jgi:hypothetical protein
MTAPMLVFTFSWIRLSGYMIVMATVSSSTNTFAAAFDRRCESRFIDTCCFGDLWGCSGRLGAVSTQLSALENQLTWTNGAQPLTAEFELGGAHSFADGATPASGCMVGGFYTCTPAMEAWSWRSQLSPGK